MSRRRKLRPSEVARQDQHLAEAAQLARDPKTLVVVNEFCTDGRLCCWCNCPDDDPIHASGGRCSGCSEPAEVLTNVGYGTPENVPYPVCRRHQPDLIRCLGVAMGPNVPTDVIFRPIFDEDARSWRAR